MSILQGLDPQAIAEHFGEVDLEYTLGDFPALTAEQIYKAYDARSVCAQVKTCNGAAILKLQSENDKLRAELEQANIEFAALTNIVNTHMMLSHDGAACMLCGTIFYSKDRQAMADYCFTHTVLCAANVLTPIERNIIHGLRDERDAAQDNVLRAANLGAEWKERAERYKSERDAAIADARDLARITHKAAGLRSKDEKSLIEKYAK